MFRSMRSTCVGLWCGVVYPIRIKGSDAAFSWRSALLVACGAVMLDGCFLWQETGSFLKHLSYSRRPLVVVPAIAPAHALNHIQASPPDSAALRFGSNGAVPLWK